MWFISKVFIDFCWKTNNFQGTKRFSLLNQTKPIWNEDASDQVAIGLSSSRSWIVCEDGAGFVDWLVTGRNDGKAQLNSTSRRVNPHPPPPPPPKKPTYYLTLQNKRHMGKQSSREVSSNEYVFQCVGWPLATSFPSTRICASCLWDEEEFLIMEKIFNWY